MAYDERLAARVREALGKRVAFEERKMFGGLCFLVRGGMALGITGDDLMVRVGRERYEAALGEPHVRPMDFTGRPLKGMVYVAPAGTRDDGALARWVDVGLVAPPAARAGERKPAGRKAPARRTVARKRPAARTKPAARRKPAARGRKR